MIAAVHISADGLTGIYLLSAICFILALKALSSPRNARYGNLVGVAGMVVAIALTFVVQKPGPRLGHRRRDGPRGARRSPRCSQESR